MKWRDQQEGEPFLCCWNFTSILVKDIQDMVSFLVCASNAIYCAIFLFYRTKTFSIFIIFSTFLSKQNFFLIFNFQEGMLLYWQCNFIFISFKYCSFIRLCMWYDWWLFRLYAGLVGICMWSNNGIHLYTQVIEPILFLFCSWKIIWT